MTRELILTQMANNLIKDHRGSPISFGLAYLKAIYISVKQKAVIL